jgi:hypothetical protein
MAGGRNPEDVRPGFGPPALVTPFRLRQAAGRALYYHTVKQDPAAYWGFDLPHLPFDIERTCAGRSCRY